MGLLFAYSIRVSLMLLLAYGGYRLGARGSAGLRRASLLGIYAVALVVAPVLLSVDFSAAAPTETTSLAKTALPEVMITTTTGATDSLFDVCLKVYVAGVAICLLLTIMQLVRVGMLLRGASRRVIGGRTVYVHTRRDLSPFSVGRLIVANAADVENEEIMVHEGAHIARRHTADLCIAQLATIVCWYCPAAWQLRRELKLVHEFQADEAVIRTGADSRSYCRLLVQRAAELRILAIANSLNHNNLKARIKMMQSPESGRCGGRMRVLLSLSAMVCGALLLSVPAVSNTIGEISQSALQARGFDTNGPRNTFVIYGVDLYSTGVRNGNFEQVSDFEAKSIDVKDVDGVIFPRIGAIFCTDKKVLERLTPGIRKYIADGKIISAKEFSQIPASDLRKVIVSGNSMNIHTRNWSESQHFDALEAAVNAENKQSIGKSL